MTQTSNTLNRLQLPAGSRLALRRSMARRDARRAQHPFNKPLGQPVKPYRQAFSALGTLRKMFRFA